MDPKNLNVIVTGGARGIGAACVRELVALGAKVMIADVIDADGMALAAETGALWQRLDVTSEADWSAAIAAATHAFGSVNALVNNAGILAFGGVTTTTADTFRHVLDVNLTGSFLGLRAAAPVIQAAGGGCVVNVSSTAGLMGYGGIAAYVASKWGLRGLTKAAALDLAPMGIRVVSVHPGPIRTPMTDGMGDELAASQPIPRYGEPDEVARLIRFLLLEASYSTGSEFVVDGGAITGQVLTLPDN